MSYINKQNKQAIAPIALFVFNRPRHTYKTINSLKNNKLSLSSDLFIFSDGPKNNEDISKVKEVRKYIKTIDGFNKIEIIFRESNLGLANSIISGVSEVIDKYGRIIVLEDDLIVNSNFLKFMNESLNYYQKKKKVFSITGYNFPKKILNIPNNYPHDVYFSSRCSSWGWGTWKDRWLMADWKMQNFDTFISDLNMQRQYALSGDDKIEMLISQKEGKIDSWAIRWDYSHFENKAYCLYPVNSFVDNVGFDGSGVHCDEYKGYTLNEELKDTDYNIRFVDEVKLDENIMKSFRKIFKKDPLIKIKKIIKKIILYEKWKKS